MCVGGGFSQIRSHLRIDIRISIIYAIGSSHCRSALDKNSVFTNFTPTPLLCSDYLYLTFTRGYLKIVNNCFAVDTLKQHWQEAKFDVFLLSKYNAYG